ncbi:MAG: glycosyltransferase [Pirellulales bacterium]|nr:glycosyltransferase [Pirellulales bacterium]
MIYRTVIRILHIVGSAISDGTIKHIASLAHVWPRTEFEIHVCFLNAGEGCGERLRGSGIWPALVRRRDAFDPLGFYRLWQHIRRLRPDIVHTWQLDTGGYARLAALAAGVKRIVVSERRIDVGRSDIQWSIDRRLAIHADYIVANGVAVRDFCIAQGLPQNKLLCLANAVLPAEPARLARSDFLAQLGLPSDAKLVLSIGPLAKEKRLKDLIWAADQLKAVATAAHLLIVGDGPLRGRLERYRWQNRIGDRVHFLGRRSDVAEFLAHADVLWQADAHEGQSSAVLEAMAAGVPVVVADAGGNRELIANGESGFLVPMSQRAGFARWTLPLLENAQLARRMGAAGRRQAEQCHQIEDIAGQYMELYRSLPL